MCNAKYCKSRFLYFYFADKFGRLIVNKKLYTYNINRKLCDDVKYINHKNSIDMSANQIMKNKFN
jgi:hypothetical protein